MSDIMGNLRRIRISEDLLKNQFSERSKTTNIKAIETSLYFASYQFATLNEKSKSYIMGTTLKDPEFGFSSASLLLWGTNAVESDFPPSSYKVLGQNVRILSKVLPRLPFYEYAKTEDIVFMHLHLGLRDNKNIVHFDINLSNSSYYESIAITLRYIETPEVRNLSYSFFLFECEERNGQKNIADFVSNLRLFYQGK